MANAWIIEPLPIVGFGASSTAVGRPEYVANDHRGVIWQSQDGSGLVQFQVDLGADRQFDTIMLFGVSRAPAGSLLQVFASSQAGGGGFSPPDWSAAAQLLYAGAAQPVSGDGVCLWSAPADFPAAIRHLLLRFTAPGGLTVGFSRAVIGRRIVLERNFSFGAGFGVKDLGSLEFSRRGVLLRNRGAKLRTTSLTFSNVRKDEVEAQTKPLLERIGNTECVAIVTDPTPDEQRQNRCYFGPLVGDLSQTWRRAGAWEAKVNMVSIF